MAYRTSPAQQRRRQRDPRDRRHAKHHDVEHPGNEVMRREP
jgi:hypothetical protein